MPQPKDQPPPRVDGRRRRRTGRTYQLSTRVTADFRDRLDRLADEQGKMYVEILEDALDALERELARKRK